jgi:selenocysteine lyase/cysteine desulfurase
VVCTSSVTEAHGARLPMTEIARACRARGVWLVVDAVQEAGARAMHLSSSGIDVATGGGHKWLGCPFGVGWLFVSRARWNELRLPHLGYLGLEPPEDGWEAYLSSAAPRVTLTPTAQLRRLEAGGTPNFPGRIAMTAAADLLANTGLAAVERAIDALTGDLIDRLDGVGVALVSPRPRARRAGIVCVTLGTPDADQRAVRALASRGIRATCRYTGGVGGIRLSLHAYNSAADVRDAAATLAAIGGRARRLTPAPRTRPATSRGRHTKDR